MTLPSTSTMEPVARLGTLLMKLLVDPLASSLATAKSLFPKDAPCYANDSSGPAKEAFCDTDVIDAEDDEEW